MRFLLGFGFAVLLGIVVVLLNGSLSSSPKTDARRMDSQTETATLNDRPEAADEALPTTHRNAAPVAQVEGQKEAPAQAPVELTEEQIVALETERQEQAAASLDTRLGSERRDPSWSVPTEKAIVELLSTDFAKGSHVVAADCRQSMCRVHIEHESNTTQRELLAELRFKAPFDTEGFVQTMGSPEAPESVVYIARANQRLFPNP